MGFYTTISYQKLPGQSVEYSYLQRFINLRPATCTINFNPPWLSYILYLIHHFIRESSHNTPFYEIYDNEVSIYFYQEVLTLSTISYCSLECCKVSLDTITYEELSCGYTSSPPTHKAARSLISSNLGVVRTSPFRNIGFSTSCRTLSGDSLTVTRSPFLASIRDNLPCFDSLPIAVL
jgi:hypothetical protein